MMNETAVQVASKVNEITAWCKQAMQLAGAEDFSDAVRAEVEQALAFFALIPAEEEAAAHTDSIPASVTDAVRTVRLAGQLPYYLSRAMGCWFAAKFEGGVTAAQVGEACGIKIA